VKINVVGLGYIGLPTALSLAKGGHEVTGTDVNAAPINSLKEGRLTFEEKGLPELFAEALRLDISFSMEPVSADVYIIAVPTPFDAHSKRIHSGYIVDALKNILPVAPKGSIVAVESTVSPGTMDNNIRPVVKAAGRKTGEDIFLAHVPERIIPGNMLHELQNNSRTIGVDEESTGKKLLEVYSVFCRGDMIVTSVKVAEMVKVAENTSRDVQIAFANELARICRRENISVHEVIAIANMHPRVNILSPGPGVGGHCISVDPWFLVGDYPDIVNIIAAARHVNDGQPEYVLNRICGIMREHNITSLADVGFYGITYKENVDDTRESPTLQLLDSMRRHLAFGAKVFDPMVNGVCEGQYDDFEKFLDDIKLLVVMVNHDHIIGQEYILKEKRILIYDTVDCLAGEDIIKL
jgi:UDP-N-acetyl-D-mannosaminuronic acid dehydrogenase